MSKLTEEQRLSVITDYTAGLALKNIAEKYGISISYAGKLAESRNLERRASEARRMAHSCARAGRAVPRRKVGDAPKRVFHSNTPDAAEVRRLAAKGIGVTQIAALLRCRYRDVLAVVGTAV
jgi:hypothetical protein